jgi:hypothetical protein
LSFAEAPAGMEEFIELQRHGGDPMAAFQVGAANGSSDPLFGFHQGIANGSHAANTKR